MGKSITAVDSMAVRLIGYEDVLSVPVLKAAQDSKWGTVLPEEIEVLGESIESMKSGDFKLSRNAKVINFLTPGLTKLVSSLTAPDPVLVEEKCIGCKKCDEACPEKSKVISFIKHDGRTIPKWNYSKCIRCFCCQELCPKGAIVTRDKALSRILGLDKR